MSNLNPRAWMIHNTKPDLALPAIAEQATRVPLRDLSHNPSNNSKSNSSASSPPPVPLPPPPPRAPDACSERIREMELIEASKRKKALGKYIFLKNYSVNPKTPGGGSAEKKTRPRRRGGGGGEQEEQINQLGTRTSPVAMSIRDKIAKEISKRTSHETTHHHHHHSTTNNTMMTLQEQQQEEPGPGYQHHQHHPPLPLHPNTTTTIASKKKKKNVARSLMDDMDEAGEEEEDGVCEDVPAELMEVPPLPSHGNHSSNSVSRPPEEEECTASGMGETASSPARNPPFNFYHVQRTPPPRCSSLSSRALAVGAGRRLMGNNDGLGTAAAAAAAAAACTNNNGQDMMKKDENDDDDATMTLEEDIVLLLGGDDDHDDGTDTMDHHGCKGSSSSSSSEHNNSVEDDNQYFPKNRSSSEFTSVVVVDQEDGGGDSTAAGGTLPTSLLSTTVHPSARRSSYRLPHHTTNTNVAAKKKNNSNISSSVHHSSSGMVEEEVESILSLAVQLRAAIKKRGVRMLEEHYQFCSEVATEHVSFLLHALQQPLNQQQSTMTGSSSDSSGFRMISDDSEYLLNNTLFGYSFRRRMHRELGVAITCHVNLFGVYLLHTHHSFVATEGYESYYRLLLQWYEMRNRLLMKDRCDESRWRVLESIACRRNEVDEYDDDDAVVMNFPVLGKLQNEKNKIHAENSDRYVTTRGARHLKYKDDQQ